MFKLTYLATIYTPCNVLATCPGCQGGSTARSTSDDKPAVAGPKAGRQSSLKEADACAASCSCSSRLRVGTPIGVLRHRRGHGPAGCGSWSPRRPRRRPPPCGSTASRPPSPPIPATTTLLFASGHHPACRCGRRPIALDHRTRRATPSPSPAAPSTPRRWPAASVTRAAFCPRQAHQGQRLDVAQPDPLHRSTITQEPPPRRPSSTAASGSSIAGVRPEQGQDRPRHASTGAPT